MGKIETSVMIDRRAEVVWEFITDLSSFPKWDIGVIEVRQTSAGSFGVGATTEATERAVGLSIKYSQRVVEYEPNRKFSLEHTSGPAKGTIVTLSIENVEGQTRFTFVHDPLKFSGLYKLIGPFLTRMVKRTSEVSAGNLKRIMESQVLS
jgi:uncharacterized protein YndB with AHSA1/START domain